MAPGHELHVMIIDLSPLIRSRSKCIYFMVDSITNECAASSEQLVYVVQSRSNFFQPRPWVGFECDDHIGYDSTASTTVVLFFLL
jgi:hypothetical protein